MQKQMTDVNLFQAFRHRHNRLQLSAQNGDNRKGYI